MEWQAMALLGAYHGLNPGMGWLFAVALGMQAGNGRAVWRALAPIALGHALAVGVIVAAAFALQLVIPAATLEMGVACALVTLGGYRLWRHRHPRYGGMRVGVRDLTIWSFLMASAHGAGFMVLPFLMPMQAPALASGHGHAGHVVAVAGAAAPPEAIALAIHTLAYFAVTALMAQLIYRKLGLMLLRTAWVNMDWVWAGALVVTGIVSLLD